MHPELWWRNLLHVHLLPKQWVNLNPWMLVLPRVVVLDKVTDLLLFFGKLLVVGGVGKDPLTHTHVTQLLRLPRSWCSRLMRSLALLFCRCAGLLLLLRQDPGPRQHLPGQLPQLLLDAHHCEWQGGLSSLALQKRHRTPILLVGKGQGLEST